MKKALQKSVFKKAILVGFCGGFIWGTLFLMMYLFNMVEVNHIAIIKKGVTDEWVTKWYAHIIFLVILSIVSSFLSFLYYFTLRKWKNWIVGVIYGVTIWLFIYSILPLLTTGFNVFSEFTLETHIGMVCIFVLYGVFVGYTISYDNAHMNREIEKHGENSDYQV